MTRHILVSPVQLLMGKCMLRLKWQACHDYAHKNRPSILNKLNKGKIRIPNKQCMTKILNLESTSIHLTQFRPLMSSACDLNPKDMTVLGDHHHRWDEHNMNRITNQIPVWLIYLHQTHIYIYIYICIFPLYIYYTILYTHIIYIYIYPHNSP